MIISKKMSAAPIIGGIAYIYTIDTPPGLDQGLCRPVQQRTVAVVASAWHEQYAAVFLTELDDVLFP